MLSDPSITKYISGSDRGGFSVDLGGNPDGGGGGSVDVGVGVGVGGGGVGVHDAKSKLPAIINWASLKKGFIFFTYFLR